MLAQTLVICFSVAIILATIITSILATATPTSGLHLALLTITPSTALHTVQSESVDGPSLLVGLLSSCARTNNAAPFTCTRTTLSPQYALSILGGNAANQALQRPPAPLFVVTGCVIGFQVIFFIMFLATAFAGELGLRDTLGKPSVLNFTNFIGLIGSLGGAMCFGILRLYFGKLCQDFNDMVQFQGAPGPNLVASIGQGLNMVWALYPLLGVVILLSFLKNHIKASSGISGPPPNPPTDAAEDPPLERALKRMILDSPLKPPAQLPAKAPAQLPAKAPSQLPAQLPAQLQLSAPPNFPRTWSDSVRALGLPPRTEGLFERLFVKGNQVP